MKRKITPYFLLLPWAIGLSLFRLYPFINSLLLSLKKYSLLSSNQRFIGLDNYIKMFTNDPIFLKSSLASIKYVAFSVPLVLLVALFVAMILNTQLKGVYFFRTVYYMPSILGGNVAIATLWRYLFENNGLINNFLSVFGLKSMYWLTEPSLAIIVISLLRAWQFGSTMVIFLAALQNVPQTYYEAAKIDGASKIVTFFRITIPLITPVILFNFVMRMVNAFQEFNSAFLITEGGPLYGTYLYNLYIYDTAFKQLNMGYASALSWFLFIIIGSLTLILFKSSKYWVYYSD